MSDGTSSVPSGWYPDPADDERLRRWDGTKWTQDVILAPQDFSVGFVPQPAPPAPTATFAPPVADAAPRPREQPAEPERTATGAHAGPATHAGPTPQSGPISLPEWANLPGLTLPPDLSGIPGVTNDSVLSAPTFAEPEPESEAKPSRPAPFLSKPDWSASSTSEPSASATPPAPPIPPRPTVQAQEFPPPPPPRRTPTPAEHYAPPPAGGHYDVPPPPGAASAPSVGLALPASSLVAPRMPNAAWSAGPALEPSTDAPVDFDSLPRTKASSDELGPSGVSPTIWTWLIALLPLIQFAVVYLVFTELGATFAPGEQWGILIAPAVLGLLFAAGDRRKLTEFGVERIPSPLLAIVPPIYLLVRTVDVGRASVTALIVWIVLQAAAVGGVFYLLPHLLAQAVAAS